mgnify:CR=1 FL=1
MSYERQFEALAAPLPPEPTVPANILLARPSRKLLTLSGYGPFPGPHVAPYGRGKLGLNRSIEEGQAAARLTAINLLLIVRQQIRSLDYVVNLVAVEGFVNCTDTFTDQPSVMNGCSDFLVSVFGPAGRHTRSAIGTNSLAYGICVEISLSLIVRLRTGDEA